MVDDRYSRGSDPNRSYREDRDYGRQYGSDRDRGQSSARAYRAAGAEGRDRGGYRDDGYGDRERGYAERGSYGGGYDRGDDRSWRSGGGGGAYRGSYASDGHRFTDTDDRDSDPRSYDREDRFRDRYAGGRDRGDPPRGERGYDPDDRGFLQRAGDEVRSWFGDEDAERRRERDQRYDEQLARYDERHRGDRDYHAWRSERIAEFDRDYDEYRQENTTRFTSEFGAWRTDRQTQRDSLSRVEEHMDVVGSDDAHVGTVDKVRGDRVVLTRNDPDAGGHHHSIPSRWIQSVDDKVRLRKTAVEAKQAWRDEERGQAMFGDQQGGNATSRTGQSPRTGRTSQAGEASQTGQYGGDRFGTDADRNAKDGKSATSADDAGGTDLNRSFPGTY